MANIAIIPARGGSKRIPRKNIKNFLGEPIISYSIRTALASALFDEVMVSTDDAEIAEVAVQAGAQVPFLRSSDTSNDHAGTYSVLDEVLNRYAENGQIFEYGCCIYPTAVLTSASHLHKGFTLLQESGFATLFPVVPFGHPIWRAFNVNEDNRANLVWPEFQKQRTQDLVKAYHDAGQFYWFHVDKLKHEKQLFTANSGVLQLSELEAQDIDNIDDWKLAELKYNLLYGKNSV